MKMLFIGDIVGSPGRQIVHDRLADLVQHRQIDLVVANGENSASGFGITPRIAEGLLEGGIHVLTGGNHSWDRKEIFEYMPHEPRLLRPGNFAEGNPGSGLYVGSTKSGTKYAVLNLQGRVFLPAIDDPFKKADAELAKLPPDVAFVRSDPGHVIGMVLDDILIQIRQCLPHITCVFLVHAENDGLRKTVVLRQEFSEVMSDGLRSGT